MRPCGPRKRAARLVPSCEKVTRRCSVVAFALYDWHYFFAQLVAGLTIGSLYALLALGYTMVYGILKLLNFAHGDVYMIGAYIGYFVLTALGGSAAPAVPIAVR